MSESFQSAAIRQFCSQEALSSEQTPAYTRSHKDRIINVQEEACRIAPAGVVASTGGVAGADAATGGCRAGATGAGAGCCAYAAYALGSYAAYALGS